ncbi:uncharacterized protein LOC135500382 [Lineus longissimus]|uniref:uncharacterized protein LOC135500382 n=1 Tax=Lineus longissimus TaxID=88925 RepID=UPI002B4EF32D
MSYPVKVHIYDLSKGLAKSMSMRILGKQLEGIWHTGILVYDEEYYFGGGGIESCPPCGTILGEPDEAVDLGDTQVPQELFWEYLTALSSERFRPETYNLFDHNCNNFSSEIAMFLTGQDIPAKILDLPKEVGDTPLGGLVRSLMESMGPKGGNTVFQLPHTRGATNVSAANERPNEATNNAAQYSISEKAEVGKGGTNFIIYPISPTSDVYKEFRENLASVATPRDLETLDEFDEYLSKDPKDLKWSVGLEHIRVLGHYLSTCSSKLLTGCLSCLIGMLRYGCQRSDVQHILTRDPDHNIMKTFLLLSYFQPSVQVEVGKLLADCCANKICCDWLLRNTAWPIPPKQTCNCDVTTSSYNELLKNGTTRSTGGAVINNLSLQELPENFCITLAQDVILMLSQELDDDIATKCLEALDRLLPKVKKELLIRIDIRKLEANVEKFAKRNGELSALCQDVERKLNLKS